MMKLINKFLNLFRKKRPSVKRTKPTIPLFEVSKEPLIFEDVVEYYAEGTADPSYMVQATGVWKRVSYDPSVYVQVSDFVRTTYEDTEGVDTL